MKRSTLYAILLSISLLCALTGCGRPSGVLPEKKMAAVLADLALVESLGDNQLATGGSTDSVYRVYRQSIMQRHGITEAEFDTTLAWYGRNLEAYSALYAAVDKQLERRQQRYEKAVNRSGDAQTNSLLPLPGMLTIGANDPDRGFSFAVDGKQLTKGDCLTLKMRFNQLEGNATVYVAAEYPNRETFFLRRQIHSSGPVEIVLQTDSARLPERVVGYVHLPEAPSRRVWVDSLSLTATPLIPSAYHRIHTATRLSALP